MSSPWSTRSRSEEHTSELQSRLHLVCRLLLEKKNKKTRQHPHTAKHDLTSPRCCTPRAPRVRHSSALVSRQRAPLLSGAVVIFVFFLKKRGPPEFSLFPQPALFRS